MNNDPGTCKGSNSCEISLETGKKAWSTPQIIVQSIVASTQTAASSMTDANFNLLS